MALRLILDTLPKQVSRQWCNAAIIRSYSNERAFKSILTGHRVASPFADPARTRTRPLAADGLKYFFVTQEDPSKDKQNALKKAKSESPPTASKSAEEVKPEPTKEKQAAERLSAIEELRLRKKALAEENKSGSSSEGPKVVGDEISSTDLETAFEMYFVVYIATQMAGVTKYLFLHRFDEDAEKEKRRKRLQRNTRTGGIILFGSSVAGLVAFSLYGRSNPPSHPYIQPSHMKKSYRRRVKKKKRHRAS